MEDFEDGIFYKFIKTKNSNKTIVFLHWFTWNSTIWNKQLDYFKDKYNILLIELVGHWLSYSPKDIEEYTHQFQSKIFLKIIKKLDITDYYIVSYSYSCNIWLCINNRNPENCKGITLISPYFTKKLPIWKVILIRFLNIFWKLFLENKKSYLDYSLLENYENSTKKDLLYTLKSINTKDFLGSLFCFYKHWQEPLLDNFESNLCIIYWENDTKFIKETKTYFERNPNIKFEKIENKWHIFILTKSEKISEIIEREAN